MRRFSSLSQDSLWPLIDTVPRAVRRAFRPDPSLSHPIRYRFIATAPTAAGFDVVLAKEGAHVRPASSETVDVTFRCDSETYVLVMYGRLTPDVAMADGRLSFEGDSGLGIGFGQRFKGG